MQIKMFNDWTGTDYFASQFRIITLKKGGVYSTDPDADNYITRALAVKLLTSCNAYRTEAEGDRERQEEAREHMLAERERFHRILHQETEENASMMEIADSLKERFGYHSFLISDKASMLSFEQWVAGQGRSGAVP